MYTRHTLTTLQVCGIVCVQSLWSRWREEKSIFRSLHELSIVSAPLPRLVRPPQTTGGSLPDHDLGLAGHHKLRGSMRWGATPSRGSPSLPRFQPSLHPRFVAAVHQQTLQGGHNNNKQQLQSGTSHNMGYNNNKLELQAGTSHNMGYNNNKQELHSFAGHNMGYNNLAFSSSSHHLSSKYRSQSFRRWVVRECGSRTHRSKALRKLGGFHKTESTLPERPRSLLASQFSGCVTSVLLYFLVLCPDHH